MRAPGFRITLAAIATLIALFVAAGIRYPGKAPMKLPPENCDQSMWNHVYEKDRLHVIEQCTAVEGRVVSVERSHDGDLHIALEPKSRSVLNLTNLMHLRAKLVVEIVCEHMPTKPAAKAACVDFHSQVAVPK